MNEQTRTYHRASSVVFLKTDAPFGGLSNMAGGFPLQVQGTRIYTSEALYQACRFPHLPEVQRLIIGQASPMTAKMKSKPHRKDSRPDWDRVRVKVMRWCLRVKLAQNWEKFSDLLLRAGDRPIVEESRRDDFWGAKAVDEQTLVGMNVLGRLLMELREAVKSKGREAFRIVEPPDIPDFLLFGRAMGVLGERELIAEPIAAGAAASVPDVRTIEAAGQQPSLFDAPYARGLPWQPYSRSSAPEGARLRALGPYAAMKDSGVPWLGEVPEHWDVRRLRNLADMRVSNIDKHSKEGEQPVRLCNYVDVYKHDYIRPSMRLMHATATQDEVDRFRLAVGDVLITKDSESWNDIGVPALVRETAPDLVSGYHLALLRPFEQLLYGEYLLRALQSTAAQYQFHVEANGVTRYGLAHSAIKSIWLPAPPLSEQAAIVRFLDHSDRRIRRYIRSKQKLIKLLEEQKQAIIQRTVTRGMDPTCRLKPSGLDWLGNVPAHWELRPAKWFFREVDERSVAGDEELLSVSHLSGVTPRSQKKITMFMAETYAGHKLCRPGDLVINTMWAWMAALGVSRHAGIVSPAYGVYRPRQSSPLMGDYVDLLLRTKPYVSEYVCRSTGIRSSRLRLYPEQFLRIPVVCPPAEEQRGIVEKVTVETAEATRAIVLALREIDLLREYRSRLIADVVTGNLDVREAAARLPQGLEESELLDETEAERDTEETRENDTDEVPEGAEA